MRTSVSRGKICCSWELAEGWEGVERDDVEHVHADRARIRAGGLLCLLQWGLLWGTLRSAMEMHQCTRLCLLWDSNIFFQLRRCPCSCVEHSHLEVHPANLSVIQLMFMITLCRESHGARPSVNNHLCALWTEIQSWWANTYRIIPLHHAVNVEGERINALILSGEGWSYHPWRCLGAVELWHLGTWSVGIVRGGGERGAWVGLDGPKGLLQPQWFYK